ncbi:MAG: hypothetical protein LLF76_13545 [Planctomycetaceae bacterium]|nr:hypothetical protein [Planctomycetaceae bacterium]
MIFRWVTLIGIALILGVIALHALVYPCGYERRFSPGVLFRKGLHVFTLLFLPQRLNWPGRFMKLAFLLGLLSFMVLFATGFGPLMFGSRLAGWLLMIHATFAPVFIACGAVIAILGAGRFRFARKDITCGRRQAGRFCCPLTDSGLGAKTGFWLLLGLSLPLTLTMVLSMLPWLGEDWQNFMYYAHRWCALAFALVSIVELYVLVRAGIRADLHGCPMS